MLRQIVEDTKHYSGVLGTCWEPRGEMAQLAFDEEYNNQSDHEIAALAWLCVLQPELDKRGLVELPLKEPYKPMPEMELVKDLGCGTIYQKKESGKK